MIPKSAQPPNGTGMAKEMSFITDVTATIHLSNCYTLYTVAIMALD